MVLSLEKAGLISRKPGVPRSIAVLLERSALPELNPSDAQPVKTNVTRYEWGAARGVHHGTVRALTHDPDPNSERPASG